MKVFLCVSLSLGESSSHTSVFLSHVSFPLREQTQLTINGSCVTQLVEVRDMTITKVVDVGDMTH